MGAVIIIAKLIGHLIELPDTIFPMGTLCLLVNKSGRFPKWESTKINAIHFLPLIVMGIRVLKMFLFFAKKLFSNYVVVINNCGFVEIKIFK